MVSVKINFDVTYHHPSNAYCIGRVVKNRHGIILGSNVVICNYIPSAFATEAVSCLHAVWLGLLLRFIDVIIKGKSLTVLNKVHSHQLDSLIIGAYIRDIHRWAASYRQYEFRHVFRDDNRVVDLLAKKGLWTGRVSYLCGIVLDFMISAVDDYRCQG